MKDMCWVVVVCGLLLSPSLGGILLTILGIAIRLYIWIKETNNGSTKE